MGSHDVPLKTALAHRRYSSETIGTNRHLCARTAADSISHLCGRREQCSRSGHRDAARCPVSSRAWRQYNRGPARCPRPWESAGCLPKVAEVRIACFHLPFLTPKFLTAESTTRPLWSVRCISCIVISGPAGLSKSDASSRYFLWNPAWNVGAQLMLYHLVYHLW